MWWGKGDTGKLTVREKRTLDDLRRLDETNHLTTLDHAQAEAGVRAVVFYQQWESVIKALTSVKNIALLVGAILTIYWASEGALINWVKSFFGASK